MSEMLKKYNAHKSSAKQRGVEFDLTFDEWRDIWDGKFQDRGRNVGQLGMLRARDEGGYTLGNVRIGTIKENRQEAEIVKKIKSSQNWDLIKNSPFEKRPPPETSWMSGRSKVFREYVEDDE